MSKFIPVVARLLLAQSYPEWSGLGGSNNYLAFGEFPQSDAEPASLYFPQGVILNRGAAAPLNGAGTRR